MFRLAVVLGLAASLLVPASAAAQEAGGYIEGSILDAATGLPALSTEGELPNGVHVFDMSGNPVGAGEPLGGGRYRIGPLPADSYKLQYVDVYSEYDTEWWRERSGIDAADPVTVVDGRTTSGIDFLVERIAAPGAWVEGRLTLVDTGEPLPAGFRLALKFVDAAVPAPPEDGYRWAATRVAWTDADGRYRLGPVAAGTYKVQFIDSSAFAYEGAGCPCTDWDGTPGLYVGWWRDAPGFVSADPVDIRANEVTVLDWSLRQAAQPPPLPLPPATPELPTTGGWIEGRLTIADTGQPVPAGFRLALDFYDLDWVVPAAGDEPAQGGAPLVAWTDDQGRYRLGPVPEGTYKTLFVDGSWFAFEGLGCPCTSPFGPVSPFIGWWRDRADFVSADPVEVRLDEVTVLDFMLRQIGEIPQAALQPEDLPRTGADGYASALAAAALVFFGLVALLCARRSSRGTAPMVG